jgi:parallel beta-helix repeat protein
LFADQDGTLTGDPPGRVLVDAGPSPEQPDGFDRGFDISGRPWVVLNGFTVTNAGAEGIAIKSGSDNNTVANCVVLSNGERGIRVRDSRNVVLFNNLVYANAETGIEFGGDVEDASGAVAVNNTIYGNGLGRDRDNDGIRIDDEIPAINVMLLNNIVVANRGIGINLKEGSTRKFVGQWNLVFGNTAKDYTDPRVSRGALDLGLGPTFVAPAGTDGMLGDPGQADDDFHLLSAVEGVQSHAVDASPFNPGKLGLQSSSTRRDGQPESGSVDLGFHFGNKTDFLFGFRKPLQMRLAALRKAAQRCERLARHAAAQRQNAGGPCAKPSSTQRLVRKCGAAVNVICR